MQEKFYLRPLSTLVNSIKHNPKPLFIEVLKPINNHSFVVEDLIDVKEYLLNNNYSKSLTKYKNLNNRINQILKERKLNKLKKKNLLLWGYLT